MADDWMGEDAEIARGREDREQRQHERRLLDINTMQADGPRLWGRIKQELGRLIDKFNAEHSDLASISYVDVNSQHFAINLSGTQIYIDIDYGSTGRGTIACLVHRPIKAPELVSPLPEQFDLEVTTRGQIDISLNGESLSEPESAKRILRPIFQSAPKR